MSITVSKITRPDPPPCEVCIANTAEFDVEAYRNDTSIVLTMLSVCRYDLTQLSEEVEDALDGD